MSEVNPNPHCIFYFDVVCPFAYIASTRIDDIARFTGADITWRPVLLGGLYDLDGAAQGKTGSASDAVPEAKSKIVSRQFQNDVNRYRVELKWHPQHPLRTVDAGRLLASFPTEHRPRLARALYRAYWVDNSNIASRQVLLRVARSLKVKNLRTELNEALFEDKNWADKLRANTEEAFKRGAFGVPWFYLPERDKSYFGQDRLHLVEAELYAIRRNTTFDQLPHLERLHPRCLRTPAENRYRQLRFWFDFTSPWSYLAWSQLERIQREAGPALEIVYKPFVVGALFKAIGSPSIPMRALTDTKQKYFIQDLSDWSEWFSAVNMQEYPALPPLGTTWPDEFPIRSITALRVSIAEPKTIECVFRAAWRDNKKISDPSVLSQVLTEAGFEGDKLIHTVTSGPSSREYKTALRANTDEAIAIGLCGAPSMELMHPKGSRIIWGADRINVLQDMIAGWHPDKSNLRASVAAFPKFDYRL